MSMHIPVSLTNVIENRPIGLRIINELAFYFMLGNFHGNIGTPIFEKGASKC